RELMLLCIPTEGVHRQSYLMRTDAENAALRHDETIDLLAGRIHQHGRDLADAAAVAGYNRATLDLRNVFRGERIFHWRVAGRRRVAGRWSVAARRSRAARRRGCTGTRRLRRSSAGTEGEQSGNRRGGRKFWNHACHDKTSLKSEELFNNPRLRHPVPPLLRVTEPPPRCAVQARRRLDLAGE